MCYLGWMLAFYRTPLTAALSRLPRTAIYGLIAAAFFLCVTTPHFGNHFELFVLGAAFLLSVIAFDLTPDLFRFLDNRALIALGNVSYSFYLFHPLFLMLLAEAFLLHAPQTLMASHLWLSTFVLWASSVMATIPFSFLSYRICEHPFTSPHPKPGSGKTPKVALLKPDVSLPASD
jgi:peptidoglycan/LPS O-acetylase OafA/YrhL